jgi:tRNA 2-selenouridine synthase
MKYVEIDEFLSLHNDHALIDVRSEAEYISGHIPKATNIPVLSNVERKTVGTLYKLYGRETALLKGLELSGPSLSNRLRAGTKLLKENKTVLVHCWRGGMRSEFYAFLLKFYGCEPLILKGGYKSFRNYVLDYFNQPFQFLVLCGKTGAGKTALLGELEKRGEQVIDLEKLAAHRGSAFGALGMDSQPTQEQFENNLFHALLSMDVNRTIWIENESRTIGDKVIPVGIWNTMLTSKRIYLESTFNERLNCIMHEYGSFPLNNLKDSMLKIGKRLGPQHVKKAVEHIENNQLAEAFSIALEYYDRSYAYNLSKSNASINATHDISRMSKQNAAELLIETYSNQHV